MGVGVAAFGAGVGGHLQHPAECDELSAGVADGRSRDFRASCGGAGGDLVGAEVDDVHAVEYLGDHPALGGYPCGRVWRRSGRSLTAAVLVCLVG